MAIITLDDYKTFKEKNSTNDDDKLTSYVGMANSYIPLYCNTSFDNVLSKTEVRVDPYGDVVALPHAPIVTVSNVKFIRSPGVEEDVYSDNYLLDNEEGVIEFVDLTVPMPTKAKSVKLDYTYGYNSVPESVKIAAFELISYYFKEGYKQELNIGNGQSITAAPAEFIPVHIRPLLDMFRVL